MQLINMENSFYMWSRTISYPEFAEFYDKQGIDSISVNPDTVDYTVD